METIKNQNEKEKEPLMKRTTSRSSNASSNMDSSNKNSFYGPSDIVLMKNTIAPDTSEFDESVDVVNLRKNGKNNMDETISGSSQGDVSLRGMGYLCDGVMANDNNN